MKKDFHQNRDDKADDFVLDPSFRKWVLNPDKSSNIYWKDWTKANPSKIAEIENAREILLSIQTIDFKPAEGARNEVWEGITSCIKNGVSEESKVLPLGPHSIISQNGRKQGKNTIQWRSLAASIAILMAVAIILYHLYPTYYGEQSAEKTFMRESPPGKWSTFAMTDGTKVTLNAGSKLTYTSGYNQQTRIVQLHGEAFFEVISDPQKPFIVHFGENRVEVLGTSFNIKAYQDSENSIVAVKTGKVSVKQSAEAVSLTPNEVVVLNDLPLNVKKVDDPSLYFGWMDKQLIFNEVTLEEAMKSISRWFGYEYEIKKPFNRTALYNSKHKNPNLREVMESLSFAYGLEYEINGNKIIVK
tara:strand:+ start:89959 stop:91032 length:1074 start_codon:yes stop_codon:yes gene_type:complete